MRRWTKADFDRIAKLREQGLTFSVIAERFGVPTKHLDVMWWLYCNGKIKFMPEQWAARREAIAQRFIDGETNSDLAKAYGISWSAVTRHLGNAGIDAEWRQEIRDERHAACGGARPIFNNQQRIAVSGS
jgi:hypothetical protein